MRLHAAVHVLLLRTTIRPSVQICIRAQVGSTYVVVVAPLLCSWYDIPTLAGGLGRWRRRRRQRLWASGEPLLHFSCTCTEVAVCSCTAQWACGAAIDMYNYKYFQRQIDRLRAALFLSFGIRTTYNLQCT